MAKINRRRINEKHSYTVHEAVDLLRLTGETIKKKCREGVIKGTQVGTKKQWHIRGSEIIRLRKLWNLDEIDR